jgi:hypothetical protein
MSSQGPALYLYNDAEFIVDETAGRDDWRGIRSPGHSQKKDLTDKVGKFGIGFSSVYHLTGEAGSVSPHPPP